MRSWKSTSSRLRLAIAAAVIVILAIGGVAAAQRFDRTGPADRSPPSAAADGSGKPDSEAKPAAKPLALGTVAKVSSNYRAAVMEISRYESTGGDFIVATVKAEYTGKESGEVWADLIVEFSDSDARTRDESNCRIDIGDGDASELPALKPGDEQTYAVCIDLGSSEIAGGKVSIEEAFAGGNRVAWSTEGAVTKEAPAPPPEASTTPGPATQPRQGTTTSNRRIEEMCDKHEDAVEKYKEGADERDERFEKNKKHYDDDEIEEFEQWRDAMDKNVERYEAAC